MLDKKKEGSLLNSTLTLTLPWDVFMWVRRFQAHPYTFDMYTARVKSEEDVAPISFIRWGEKVLTISLTQAPVSSPTSEETALKGLRETYPRGARIIKSTPTFKVGEGVCTICATPMGRGHNFVNGDTNQGIIKPAHPFREGKTHGKA